jgi:hypothetical protein
MTVKAPIYDEPEAAPNFFLFRTVGPDFMKI